MPDSKRSPSVRARCPHCGCELTTYGACSFGCPESASTSPYGSDEQSEGLLPKYLVRRNNDVGGKHDQCRYFVLDPQHDLIARRALAYYANDAREEGYTGLADDLEGWVRSLWEPTPNDHERTAPPC